MSRPIALRVTLFSFTIACIATAVRMVGAAPPPPNGQLYPHEAEFTAVRDTYIDKFKPLFIESNTASWEANISGSDAAYTRKKEADKKLIELHSDKAVFAKLKMYKTGGRMIDPTLIRELDVMYRTFLPGQADPDLQKRIVTLESDVEQMFNTHRSEVEGKKLTENDVRKVLSDGTDSAAAEKAWKAYMEVGRKVEKPLHELVSLRNKLAVSQGYKNFWEMKLGLDEIGGDQLIALFDELDTLTREPFAKVKGEIDDARAARYHVGPGDLRPWHYGDLFFQEAPRMGTVDLDEIYKKQDLLKLTKDYYASLGMSIDDILARSDLYEKPGKCPHAFCTNINKGDDIRVLCNVKPNLFWADTNLHEIGHAVYDKYINPGVPFLLHEPSHSLTTEGYAMMMGSMCKKGEFFTKMLKLPPAEAEKYAKEARRSLRAEKLIFSRWTQVMVRFEQGMYSNPDQDLGKLWWDLKARYQLLRPPGEDHRPDYAAKIHVVTTPVYYHSYMMGELFACQVENHIAQYIAKTNDITEAAFVGQKEVGDYLRRAVFGPGDTYSWNDLTRKATGEFLTAKHFATMYVK